MSTWHPRAFGWHHPGLGHRVQPRPHRLRIEMLDDAGASIFGAIEQKVVEAAAPNAA